MENEKIVNVYCDGACSGNPGPAGAGIVIDHDGITREIGIYLGYATNNIAELESIKYALVILLDLRIEDPIHILTDSQYSINILTNEKWEAKKNVVLIEEVKHLVQKFKNVNFSYVAGHKGHMKNERANTLAVSAIKKEKLKARG